MTFPVVGSNIPSAYQISNSLRFNRSDSAYLSKTLSTPTDRRTWTFSFWLKRSVLGNGSLYNTVFSTGNLKCRFEQSDTFQLYDYDGNFDIRLVTSRVFRDTSAWYHFCIVMNIDGETGNDRTKLYINGVRETWSGDDPASYDPRWNYASTHNIGRDTGGTNYFGGYLSEMHFIDGQALSPTDFGEFDGDNGVWKPKQYAGTYGINGFYLKFNNSGNMGEDSSGNDNTWTPTNLSGPTDVTTDTPTNNFATLSPLLTDTNNTTFSEGNCKNVNTNASSAGASIAVGSGKWYCEMICTAKTAVNAMIGISTVDGFDGERQADESQNGGIGYAYVMNATIVQSNATGSGAVSYGATWAVNDIIGIALDLDSTQNTITFYKNGVSQGAHNINDREYVFTNSNGQGGGTTITYSNNFGNPPHSISSGNTDDNGYGNFEYAPPSGYLALCTQNLATELSPTIDDGSQYFNTVLYTGNGGTKAVTGVGFASDFVWLKERSSTSAHRLADTTRGATKSLSTSANGGTNAELTNSDILASFDSDGFTVGANNGVNESGVTYASWNWKANGGTTSSNTDGSITSTVQANTTAGFSIVTYTGTGATATFGHGLGAVPKMVIIKDRDNGTKNWTVYHNAMGNDRSIFLNLINAQTASTDHWQNTTPTSSIVYIGDYSHINTSGNDYVAYCFAEIEGYSKFGSYTGNASTDGTFIYTGFKPSWVMIKRYDSTGGAEWVIQDTTRRTFNPVNVSLYPNLNNAEATGETFRIQDTLSNGFKIRSSTDQFNGGGASYIYMAFAENPFVTSGATPVTAR